MEMAATNQFRENSAKWLLFLTIIHTVPVVWLTPVAGGTAPTVALLAFCIASLFTSHRELGGILRDEHPAWASVVRRNSERFIQVGALLGADSVGTMPAIKPKWPQPAPSRRNE